MMSRNNPTLIKIAKACSNGDLETVKQLVPKIKPELLNSAPHNFTQCPLFLAISKGHLPIVKYLLDDCSSMIDPFIRDEFGFSAVHVAVDSLSVEVLQFLLSHPLFVGQAIHWIEGSMSTPLHLAAMRGNVAFCKILLEAGSDVQRLRSDGRENCLHLAAHSGCIETVKLMIRSGLTCDTPCGENQTPIFKAIKSGHFELVKYFTEVENVNLNWADDYGVLPRDLADSRGMTDIAIYLARKGALSFTERLRNPRDLLVTWNRIWVQGDLPSARIQPNLERINNDIYLNGGDFTSSRDLPDFSCYRIRLSEMVTAPLRPVLAPEKRTNRISKEKIGMHLKVEDNIDEIHAQNDEKLEKPRRICTITHIGSNPSSINLSSSVLFETPFKFNGPIGYYEVKILKLGATGAIAVGLAEKNYLLDNNLPGWENGSYAYHSDDGSHFINKGMPVPWGPPGKEGDVIGIGIVWKQSRVFFTLNGSFLGMPETLELNRKSLYGCVGIAGAGCKVEVNFGDCTKNPWLFNFEVQTVLCERLGLKTAAHMTRDELIQMSMYAFTRVTVRYQKWIISVSEGLSFAHVYNIQTQELGKLTYKTKNPIEVQGNILQVSIMAHYLICVDCDDNLVDPDGLTPHLFDITKPIDYINLCILNLKTRSWFKARVDLKHLNPKPKLNFATHKLPIVGTKLMFLASPTHPFYVELQNMRAYSINEAQKKMYNRNPINLWQYGSAFDVLPSVNEIQEENESINNKMDFELSHGNEKRLKISEKIDLNESDKNEDSSESFYEDMKQVAQKLKTNTESDYYALRHVNGDEELKVEGSEGMKDLAILRGYTHDTEPQRPYTIIKTWQSQAGLLDESYEDEIEQEEPKTKEQSRKEGLYSRSQIMIFGGLLRAGVNAILTKNNRIDQIITDEDQQQQNLNVQENGNQRIEEQVQMNVDHKEEEEEDRVVQQNDQNEHQNDQNVQNVQNQNLQITHQQEEDANIDIDGNDDDAHHHGLRDALMDAHALQEERERNFDRNFADVFENLQRQEQPHLDAYNEYDAHGHSDLLDGAAEYNSEVALFDPKSMKWSMPRVQGTAPVPRGSSGIAYGGNGYILSFGGWSGRNALDDIDLMSLSTKFSKDDKLGSLFNNPILSDLKIQYQNSSKLQNMNQNMNLNDQIIFAHKAIVAGRSNKLCQMILEMDQNKSLESQNKSLEAQNKSFEDQNNSNQSNCLIISSSNHRLQMRLFPLLVQFLYCDTIPESLKRRDFLDYIDLAEEFCPEHVPRLCEILLLNHLSVEGSQSLMHQLGSIFDSGLFADVKVVVEGKEILCHRAVISCRSDYFKNLFSGNMMEGIQGIANIENISYDVCLHILRYLYSLRLDYQEIAPFVVDVLVWSQIFAIPELTEELESVIGANLTEENVHSLLELAQNSNMFKLKRLCQMFIDDYQLEGCEDVVEPKTTNDLKTTTSEQPTSEQPTSEPTTPSKKRKANVDAEMGFYDREFDKLQELEYEENEGDSELTKETKQLIRDAIKEISKEVGQSKSNKKKKKK